MSRWVGSVLALMLAPSLASAGNDDEIFVGNEAALMSGAVTATVRDGSAIWYNPAGLAGVEVNTLNVSASAFALRQHRAPRFLSAQSGEVAEAKFLEFVSAPSALTYVRPITDDLRGAFGVFVTRASDLAIDALLDVERISSVLPTSARVLLALDYAETTYHLGPSVGWRVHDDLWIGGSVLSSLQQVAISTLYAGGTPEANLDTIGLFNQSERFDLTVFGVLLNAGVQWQMTDRLRLGVTVQSPTVELYGSVSQPVVRSGLALAPGRRFYGFSAGRVEGSRSSFEPIEPARVRAGVAYTRPGLALTIDGDVRPGLSGARAFRWNLRAGARYAYSATLEVGAGLFTDRSAALDPSAFGSRDQEFYGGTLGGTYLTALKLAEDREAVTFATTLGLRYAYGSGTVGGVVVPTERDNVNVVLTSPSRLTTHEVALHLGSAVRF